jgi:hypothetical protein
MPVVRHKFSQCGHKALGLECPVCKDIKKGILIEVVDKGEKKLVCPRKSEREALKRKVKVGDKEVDVKEIETAIKDKK